MIQLREHQVEAKRAIVRAAALSARMEAPARGVRATVVSATGSGKTYTAAAAALDLYRHGRVLVMVPTLELLVQGPVVAEGRPQRADGRGVLDREGRGPRRAVRADDDELDPTGPVGGVRPCGGARGQLLLPGRRRER
ncbi:hypothetical protein GCM10010381_57960 [Streptomyces xantholiticus]|nr:hypothetical protein GCM10010381_57960 [Streptomyces xantholiticus]